MCAPDRCENCGGLVVLSGAEPEFDFVAECKCDGTNGWVQAYEEMYEDEEAEED